MQLKQTGMKSLWVQQREQSGGPSTSNFVCTYMGVDVLTWVWAYLHGCGCTYMGVGVLTWVWMYLHGCRCTYMGLGVLTRV